MDDKIAIKESILKADKEENEKLMKEGYKEITNGPGYSILSKENKEASFNVISYINPLNIFDINNAQVVNTNFQIDRHIKMKNPPDPLVIIKMPSSKIVKSSVTLLLTVLNVKFPTSFECSVIPCSAFMRYIKSYPIVGTVVETLEKRKGFTSRFNVSTEIKSSVSAGFFGCEASLEVTTGFEYEETVSSETIKSWQQTLTEGTYIVYQNVIVYAYILSAYDDTIIRNLNFSNVGINIKNIPNVGPVFFVPVNRDDPFTLRYQDAVWDPVEYDTLVEYLFANSRKWKP